MIKKTCLILLALVTVLKTVRSAEDEELIMSKLDLNRIAQININAKSAVERCRLIELELRKMLQIPLRETLKSPLLFEKASRVISNQRAFAAGGHLTGPLMECADWVKNGFRSRQWYPQLIAHEVVEDSEILAKMDFQALMEVASASKTKETEEKCEDIERKLREMLAPMTGGLTQSQLFKRLLCALNGHKDQLYAAGHYNLGPIWYHLNTCAPGAGESC